MHAPQITLITLNIIGLLFSAYKTGEQKDPSELVSALVSTAISQGIVYWGGFYG